MSILAQLRKAVGIVPEGAPAVGEGLVVQHSMSKARAEAMLGEGREGRIPSPSIGVVKEDMPVLQEEFGAEVTLIGEPSLLDEGRLYETDVYGVRHPYLPPGSTHFMDESGWRDEMVEATPENITDYFNRVGDVLTESGAKKRLPGTYIGEILADIAESFPVAGKEGAQAIRSSVGPRPENAEEMQKSVSSLEKEFSGAGLPSKTGTVFLSELATAYRRGQEGEEAFDAATMGTLQRVPGADGAIIESIYSGDIVSDVADRIEKAARYLATTPKQYMEQRPGRVVELGKDFKTALVLDNRELDPLVEKFHKKGVAVIRVPSKKERQEVYTSEIKELEKKFAKALKDKDSETMHAIGKELDSKMFQDVDTGQIDPEGYAQAMAKLRKAGKVFVMGGTAVGAGLLVDGASNQAYAATLSGESEEAPQQGSGTPQNARSDELESTEGRGAGRVVALPLSEASSRGLMGAFRAASRRPRDRQLSTGRPDLSTTVAERALQATERRLGLPQRQHGLPSRQQEQTGTRGQTMTDMSKPRGIRNNNPGNIDYNKNNAWKGQVGIEDGVAKPRFAKFDTPQNGVRALAKLLLTYQKKYKLYTPEQILNRWAPPQENDTGAYAQQVARALGVNSNERINLDDEATLFKLVKAIIKHENGSLPYEDSLIMEGVNAVY